MRTLLDRNNFSSSSNGQVEAHPVTGLVCQKALTVSKALTVPKALTVRYRADSQYFHFVLHQPGGSTSAGFRIQLSVVR